MPWRCWSVSQREAEIARARPWLYDVHARWRSLSPFKGTHRVPEEKQDICAGMAREQARSQSSGEPVDYYEG